MLFCAGCGTVASAGEADRDLPNNRTGPFRELSITESGNRECIADFNGAFDDPSAVSMPDGSVVLYGSRTVAAGRSIARIILPNGLRSVGDPVNVVTAMHAWESGAVSAPSVVRVANGYAMAYAAGGAIGLARSADGVAWTTSETPWFTGDPSAGEMNPPASPAMVVGAEGAVTLAYESTGAIWLARAASLDAPLVRVDADPSTAARDPIVTAARPSADGGYASTDVWVAGSVGDPSLDVETTPAGRPLWRVYFTAHTAPFASDGGLSTTRSVGMAASFDGRRFSRTLSPVFTLRADGNPSAPSLLTRSATVTTLYVGARCDLGRFRRGVKVIVAPASTTLTP